MYACSKSSFGGIVGLGIIGDAVIDGEQQVVFKRYLDGP
jgi:hypothetical protein